MIITSRCFVFNTFEDNNNNSDILYLKCAIKCSYNSYDLKEQGNIFFTGREGSYLRFADLCFLWNLEIWT